MTPVRSRTKEQTTSYAVSIGSSEAYAPPAPSYPRQYRLRDYLHNETLVKLASNAGRGTWIRIGTRQLPAAVELEAFVLGEA